jgi:hypothetical protein
MTTSSNIALAASRISETVPELDGSQVAEISSSQGGPCYSHDEIAEAQARTSDDLAGQPAGSNADDQYDEEAFIR